MLKEADSIGNYHLTIKDRPGDINFQILLSAMRRGDQNEQYCGKVDAEWSKPFSVNVHFLHN